MQQRVVIKVGNSLAVTLPKAFTQKANINAGDAIAVETNWDIPAVYIRPASLAGTPGLTPDFKAWLDEIASKERDVIQALAKA